MKSVKIQSKLLIACIALISVAALLKASYYKPDFFPIGLTGLNHTGWGPRYDSTGCPYGNIDIYPYWTWDQGTQSEKALIEALGVNCLGCSDATFYYLINWGDTNNTKTNKYLYKVCKPSFDDDATDTMNNVYLIPNTYYVTPRFDSITGGTCSSPICTTVVRNSPTNFAAAGLFRAYYRQNYTTYGSWKFAPAPKPGEAGHDTIPYCCGSEEDNDWTTCTGTDAWRTMVDSAVINFKAYFDDNDHANHENYMWGFNLIIEDPAMGRRFRDAQPWHGVWAAVDRILNGSNSEFDVDSPCTTQTGGFRGMEESCFNEHHMVIAKNSLAGCIRSDYDIFQYLPDIDAFVLYTQPVRSWYNYGDEALFDYALYGEKHWRGYETMNGYHHYAVYMQEYGNDNLAYSDQTRRLVMTLSMEWNIDKNILTKAYARRPCPPEIRCLTYLAFSRGYTGILFHPWLNDYSSVSGSLDPSQISIPTYDSTDKTMNCYNLGLRDQQGYPFGYPGRTQYLNKTAPNAPAWNHVEDNTYTYLKDTLIPEIKAIASTLVHLDWVNAYSLKSTSSQWEKPGSHMYISWIVPWGDNMGDGYIDLAFFDDPDDIASEYFMVVNRDGIADMDTATLQIAVDGSRWTNTYGYINKLIVKNMADTTDTFVLTPSNGYIFTDIFAPGEGKLYRVRGGGGGCVPIKLHLWGEWREGRWSTDYMESFVADTSLGWAVLHCRWHKDKPATLQRHIMWGKICSANTWVPCDSFSAAYDQFGNCYPMQDSCMRFVAVGEHPDGDTLDSIADGLYGTESNKVQIVHPGSIYPGCPDLYSFFYQDTNIQPGHVFMENNTILPHSQHVQAINEDLLKLDVLNTEPDHYYMAVTENDDEISYLDQVKLWVVDHDADEQVATSADDSIYVYSDMVGPASCKDQGNNDKLDQILWEDTASFAGPANSYLTVKFSDPGWTYAGLLISLGDRSEVAPPPKDYLSIPSEPGGGGTWDSLGVAYGRMNPCQWLVDVSECDSFTFRVYCGGSDTCFIDRIALVKLESSGWSLTEAVLDSAVHYYPNGTNFSVGALLIGLDTLGDTLKPDHQVSFRFDKVDTSATYPARDFVFQSRGYYYSPLLQKSGIEEVPLEFGLEVQQITPLSRAAHISYSVPYAINVKIGVYDVTGRLVKSVVNGKVKPGKYCEEWQGKDNAGRTLASGVYFVKMMTEDFEKTDKIVILE